MSDTETSASSPFFTIADIQIEDREISVRTIFLGATYDYSSLLEGYPSDQVSRKALESIKSLAKRIRQPWAIRLDYQPYIGLKETNYITEIRYERPVRRLPNTFVILELHSAPISHEEDYSVVEGIFFQDSLHACEIEDLLLPWIKGIPWAAVATDFSV